MTFKTFEIKFGHIHLRFPDTKHDAEIAIKLIEEYLKWETTVSEDLCRSREATAE